MTTLLVGATGLLGSEIARRLTNQGRSVRALPRSRNYHAPITPRRGIRKHHRPAPCLIWTEATAGADCQSQQGGNQ